MHLNQPPVVFSFLNIFLGGVRLAGTALFYRTKWTDLLEVCFSCLLRRRPGRGQEGDSVNIPSSEVVMKLGRGQSGASL